MMHYIFVGISREVSVKGENIHKLTLTVMIKSRVDRKITLELNHFPG